ncbi:MAG: hypothetical protein ACFFA3_19845, partial [Promethearchaeota archaeon]
MITSIPLYIDSNNKANNPSHEQDIVDKSFLSFSSTTLPNVDYFSYYKVIIIDHTKVNGSGNHKDFPVLISIIDSDLDDNAQLDGDDIAFANSSDWLDHELELFNPSYSATEAQLIAWVRIPLLSTSIDTIIFMFYGNSTITSRENPTGVWNSNYEGVWHLKEDPGFSGIMRDSTINGNDGTAISMGSGDQVLGQIDGSLDFEVDDYVTIGNVGPEIINTVEFWMRPDSLGSYSSYNTGYHSPTATGDYYNQWFNPANAYTSNNIYATEATNYDDQDWYNFGFSIPAGVSIDGIEVSIEGSSSQFGQYVGCRVYLSGNGGSSYTSYKSPQSWSSTYDYYRTVGSSSDTWGESWTPSNFSNLNFRVRLEKTGSSFTTLRVDHIRIIVYYSTSADNIIMDLNGIDQIRIDQNTEELKPISFPGSTIIYVNGATGSSLTAGTWQHIVITDTTGVSASALDIARNASTYFDGAIDEFRLSKVIRSADWIATEFNNQKEPNNFYSVGAESTPFTNLQVNAIDLNSNSIPNVNISMYEDSKLIRTGISDSNGNVIFNDLLSLEDEFNFTVSMISNIAPYHTIIINRTSKAILIEGTSQIINLICNISKNTFNVFDADGISLDSGWIIVGNSSDLIQNCTIDNTGQATFSWLNIFPYQYNYTVWYHDSYYNPAQIQVASGDLLTPNSVINVTTNLTTINFTALTQDESQLVSGLKLILNNTNTGENIVNLITGLNGEVAFRWVNSSGINSNYSLSIDFYGEPWQFEVDNLTTGLVFQVDF